jgi:outer membrane receptor for ferric coprogen and ferric-rhodotorulic acid
MEGDSKLKHLMRGLILLVLIISVSTIAFAAETVDRGSVTVLAGNGSAAWFNYHLTDKLDLTGNYVNEDVYKVNNQLIRAGLDYDLSDRLGVKAGVLYDSKAESTVGYGGFDFSLPFGTNLHLNGFYDYNYQGENWGSYETVIRIEMYKNHYLDAGVMGNTGSGAQIYDYNDDKEAMLFMRGDFNWKFGKTQKFGIELRPVVMVKGDCFSDFDFSYQFNERTKLILNMNSLWDKDLKYRIGFEHKF